MNTNNNDTCFICKREVSEKNKMCKFCADFYIWFISHRVGFEWSSEKVFRSMAELIKQQTEVLELENDIAIYDNKQPKPIPTCKELWKLLKNDLGMRFEIERIRIKNI